MQTMIGSEKQIAWAKSIRANMLPKIEEIETYVAGMSDERYAELRQIMLDVIASVKDEPSASWWIDKARLYEHSEIKGYQEWLSALSDSYKRGKNDVNMLPPSLAQKIS